MSCLISLRSVRFCSRGRQPDSDIFHAMLIPRNSANGLSYQFYPARSFQASQLIRGLSEVKRETKGGSKREEPVWREAASEIFKTTHVLLKHYMSSHTLFSKLDSAGKYVQILHFQIYLSIFSPPHGILQPAPYILLPPVTSIVCPLT